MSFILIVWPHKPTTAVTNEHWNLNKELSNVNTGIVHLLWRLYNLVHKALNKIEMLSGKSLTLISIQYGWVKEV